MLSAAAEGLSSDEDFFVFFFDFFVLPSLEELSESLKESELEEESDEESDDEDEDEPFFFFIFCFRRFLLDNTTRLVLIDKAIFGESLDDIIVLSLLLFFLLLMTLFSLIADHLLDEGSGFLRQSAALAHIRASAGVRFMCSRVSGVLVFGHRQSIRAPQHCR